ncbi:uncharacterized protein TRUGW13939_03270 [Talaromyces rugulosus]|uniref:Aminoglycoside phosphotransferase domain-containing protein n=1 Tax=Talaromyces rugulosus TaxID=121627 RepID=A0A7H8QQD9_TALRU|nr:uncharacterized protein TRUGW13939_03270 [Talaromyces rugulosus]QKX56170.1 hypothetical protein TRUGW13939_03270 [Talaromyces rugulosus]
MSVSLEKPSSLASRFRDALPSVFKKSRNSEIWGVDIKHAEWQVVEMFWKSHSAIPALQLPRAIASLENTLEWRCFSEPRDLLAKAKSIHSDLNMCHITLDQDQYVLWVSIDEVAIKAYTTIHQSLGTAYGLMKPGLAVIEKLSTLLLHAAASSDPPDYSASCVVEFKTHHANQNTKRGQQPYQQTFCKALKDLATLIRYHYPSILGKAYIINPREEYLVSLDIDEALLRNTTILANPEDLALHLGSQIPPRYGGTGKSFAESDFLHRDSEESTSLETPEVGGAAAAVAASSTEIEKTEADKETTASSTCTSPKEDLETEEQPKLRLIYSETIGPPSIILDPDDLHTAEDLCPDKMGARVCFADSDMVVKFGHGVGLGEAEALHLASTRTTIVTPKLLSAYILDGVGYIVMSYERGEPLNQYWDRVSPEEQNRVLETLRDYVNQMREIPGDFIGPLDRSPCRDGIFEAGYGDYTRYSYGPYESEESFDEGIIQALRDRFPPKVFDEHREDDMESTFFNGEYMLYQTVRELKNHKIVFTHADLHPGNIIVRADGTVVLLDWGLAGFWPEYWEFYRAMNSIPWRTSWDRMVEKFIPPFYIEYSVMKRVFGTVWN